MNIGGAPVLSRHLLLRLGDARLAVLPREDHVAILSDPLISAVAEYHFNSLVPGEYPASRVR